MTWRTSPVATELESVVLRWIRTMVGLPAAFTGVVYDTASVATLHALAAAREAAGVEAREQGLAGRAELPTFVVYASDQAHSSVEKAAIVLGLGAANVRKVESDAEYRMSPSALRVAIARDRRARRRPLAVVATVGTTSTTAVDPVPAIADVCAAEGLWLHVDAAYGGALGLLPEARGLLAGLERADSVVVNPHKWLFVPLDFSALYTRRPDVLRSVFALVPEYLQGDARDGETNYMDYGIQHGRRFRALKAWMVFRAFGRAGLERRVREHVRLARLFASWVEAEPGWQVLAPVPMGVVCFRAAPTGAAPEALDRLNESVLADVNASGEAYLTQTRLRGRIALRLAVGNVLTTEHHLGRVWALAQRVAERARGPGADAA